MSDQPYDGGPAFACPGRNCEDGWQQGMSLRAWLAGQALTGLLANGGVRVSEAPKAAIQAADETIRQLGLKPAWLTPAWVSEGESSGNGVEEADCGEEKQIPF